MTVTPITLKNYALVWNIKRGNAIDPGGTDLERDSNNLPILETGETSWFHQRYKWNSVELKYEVFENEDRGQLSGYEVEVAVYSYNITTTETEETYSYVGLEDFTVDSIKFRSSNPNGNKPWIDNGPPVKYGGVILFEEDVPVEKSAGEYYRCGLDGSNESRYDYLAVFDRAKFSFVPRNSYDALEAKSDVRFQREPLYPDVRDPNGLAAPIYPMNAITSFLPDDREFVTVTYTIDISIRVRDEDGNLISVELPNNSITIDQTCVQDTSDYIRQLERVSELCQFQNPGGWSREELSPNYNYDYPYTLVTGYDGLDNVTTPFTRTDGSELQRGDVWYNPNTDQRLTWNIGDVPESISVERSGYGYRDSTNLPAVYVMPTDDNGMPLRTFKDTATTSLPSGLLVDVQTEDGKVVSVIPSESSSPTGWTDGDTISIVGGSNTAMCRINIRNPAGWSDKFINKY